MRFLYVYMGNKHLCTMLLIIFLKKEFRMFVGFVNIITFESIY